MGAQNRPMREMDMKPGTTARYGERRVGVVLARGPDAR